MRRTAFRPPEISPAASSSATSSCSRAAAAATDQKLTNPGGGGVRHARASPTPVAEALLGREERRLVAPAPPDQDARQSGQRRVVASVLRDGLGPANYASLLPKEQSPWRRHPFRSVREKVRVFMTGDCEGLADLRGALERHLEVDFVGSAASLARGRLGPARRTPRRRPPRHAQLHAPRGRARPDP